MIGPVGVGPLVLTGKREAVLNSSLSALELKFGRFSSEARYSLAQWEAETHGLGDEYWTRQEVTALTRWY